VTLPPSRYQHALVADSDHGVRPSGHQSIPPPAGKERAPADRSTIDWRPLVLTALVAASTYVLRWALAAVGLQGLTFVVPILFAAYFFGSIMAAVAAVLSLAVAHTIVWYEATTTVLFTRQYFSGIANYAIIAALIVLYTRRHELVLRRLDRSLEREKSARAQAEEASRLKDQFLATLSHELRTPINVILGYVQMLRADSTPNAPKVLEIVQRNAEQQARLIEDVLDASRIATGTIRVNSEPVVATTLIREVVESLRPAITAKGLTIDVRTPPHPETILGDPQRLRQVFWNILSNAVKFTGSGGHIAVSVARDGDSVAISVRDNGRGIAPEFLPHVFDMFRQEDSSSTRDTAGMGLGLSLVKRFVELQGGEVTAESDGAGKGATFTCRFPGHPASRLTPA
jgi:signal transduction histidine kinase